MISGAVVWGSRSRLVPGAEESTARTRTGADQASGLDILGRSVCLPDGRKAVLLEPERWVGKRLPLLPYIQPETLQQAIAHSEKEIDVILIRWGCDRCRALVTHVTSQAEPGDRQVIFLEVSSHKSPRYSETRTRLSTPKFGRLIDSVEWHLSTPLIISVLAQQVTDVRSDKESISYQRGTER